jgi:hypothetical protein
MPHDKDWFDDRAMPEPNSGCWIWIGGRNPRGYGLHRGSWESARGPIAPGLVIDHLCRNTWCVNLSHLEPVTQAENVRRARPLVAPCGHAYDMLEADGGRRCRACRNKNWRQRYHRRIALGR